MSYCIRARRFGWIPALTGAPATPAVPTVTSTPTALVLDWADNTEADVVGYRITRRLTGVGSYVEKATRVGSRYADQSAVEGTGYDYQITAIDAQGKVSAVARTVVNAILVNLPVAVTGLAAVDHPGVKVTLTWDADTADSDLAGYVLTRSTTSGGTYAAIAGAPASTALLTQDDATAADDTQYFYKIRAKDAVGNLGPLSAAVSVTHAAAP